MELRAYQEKGKVDIYDGWRSHKRIMFQLVTGGGKTVIFVNIIKDILKKGKRVMLIAHREELIDQAWKTLYKNKIFAGKIKSKEPQNFSLPCQVASIQTLSRRKKLPHCDVIIFDEGHHCQDDNSYGNLLDNFYDDAFVLAVTATPYRLSGKGFRPMFSQLILSKSYSELVEDGYLTPFKYFLGSVPDLKSISTSKGEYNEAEAEKVMQLAPIVESYLEHCKGKSGIVFAVNIHHSKTIAQKYNEAGIKAAHLDADTKPEDRKFIISQFKKKHILIIVNVGITTEGFDVPDMDFVQLARPTMSLSLYIQMCGRPGRVNQQLIQGIRDPEERKRLIAASEKTHSIVLDNAGCWINHGLPDQYINWQEHFDGFDKKKKKQEAEMIEMIEYIAEDESGYTVKTKNPIEIEGMKLIEVKHHIKDNVLKVTSIKKFDELYILASRLKAVKKKGFFTFYKFIEHCEKGGFQMDDTVWKYLTQKLYNEPKDMIDKAEIYRRNTEAGIREQYAHNPNEIEHLLKGLNKQVNDRIDKSKLWLVPGGFIKKQRIEHDEKMRRKEKLRFKLKSELS